jgi:hypothetical protein
LLLYHADDVCFPTTSTLFNNKWNALWSVNNAFVMSGIIYLNPIWICAPETKIKELKIVQNRLIKAITNRPSLAPTNSLYNRRTLSLEVYSLPLNISYFENEKQFVKTTFRSTDRQCYSRLPYQTSQWFFHKYLFYKCESFTTL